MRLELLKQLSEAAGIPGYEERIRAIVRPELEAICDEVSVDALGNVIGIKRGTGDGTRRKVMLAGHIDEIGFMVNHISDSGFLRLQPLGGFDRARADPAARARPRARRPDLSRRARPRRKPIHLLNESDRNKPPRSRAYFVDLGLPGERVKGQVEIGDMVTLDRTLEEIGDCVIGKAMDDRLSVFVMIEAVRAMRRPTCDIYVVATTQEEVGLRGATTSAYAIDPDISIALDITLRCDMPGDGEARPGHEARRRHGDQADGFVADLPPEARARLPRHRRARKDPAPARNPAARRHRRRGDAAHRGATPRSPSPRRRATSTPSTRWPTSATSRLASTSSPASSKKRTRSTRNCSETVPAAGARGERSRAPASALGHCHSRRPQTRTDSQ